VWVFVVPGSKIAYNYDAYIPNKCRNGQCFALVVLSKTKAMYSLLTDVFDMFPTILGPNFDISSMEFFRALVSYYSVGLAQTSKIHRERGYLPPEKKIKTNVKERCCRICSFR